jgi:hypothetical protein
MSRFTCFNISTNNANSISGGIAFDRLAPLPAPHFTPYESRDRGISEDTDQYDDQVEYLRPEQLGKGLWYWWAVGLAAMMKTIPVTTYFWIMVGGQGKSLIWDKHLGLGQEKARMRLWMQFHHTGISLSNEYVWGLTL